MLLNCNLHYTFSQCTHMHVANNPVALDYSSEWHPQIQTPRESETDVLIASGYGTPAIII